MKKVKITTRAVYHKMVSVEVEVPSHVEDENVRDWLWDNEHFFIDELDDKLSDARYEFGRGLVDGMDDDSSDSETRFDVVKPDGTISFGGHC